MKRVLVANRGEIAVRIIRACREASLSSVAVYSDVDRAALHVRLADEAVPLGGTTPAESYLVIDRLIDAARRSQADAIHPGYGFLSERAAFARACEHAGIIFIGPTADAIEQMGSKIGARELMERAGVPVVPGMTPVDQGDDGIAAVVKRIGYPALIKASAGGGGKGMRVVRSDGDVADAAPAARREAEAAFGDGTLYVERLIEQPRHVEVQVFGDAHGHYVHLFERECSIQRRHQKVIEESPSPVLTAGLRARMGEAAIAAARAVDYRNAGTIEFLLEGAGDNARFYFLEMNTRLQVEHPVTEAVTGLDLVRAQFAVAAGAPLPWTQQDLLQRGHAIECRVYAEDPRDGFFPQAGPLALYREPSGPGIRVDSGFVEGDEISVNYDPLIAKVIAFAESRPLAIDRMRSALKRFPVLGIRTNISFLLAILEHADFEVGSVHTGFIDAHLEELTADAPSAAPLIAAAAHGLTSAAASVFSAEIAVPDPWATLRGWGR